jgi:hypothetical protein
LNNIISGCQKEKEASVTVKEIINKIIKDRAEKKYDKS